MWKLDRLGRSVKEVLTLADELHQRGIGLRILTGHLAGTYTGSDHFLRPSGLIRGIDRTRSLAAGLADCDSNQVQINATSLNETPAMALDNAPLDDKDSPESTSDNKQASPARRGVVARPSSGHLSGNPSLQPCPLKQTTNEPSTACTDA